MREMAKRKVDELGRVVLPTELRKELGIDEKDELSIYIRDDEIVLKKAQQSCFICKNADNLKFVDNKPLCSDCIAKIKEI